MLVRRDPPTFGFQRLAAHITAYSRLGVFIAQMGDPESDPFIPKSEVE
jgi:hypothetical protein